jgi:2-polyprenyl-3-methyl-5-hydroxy-6-metoxy-1,4-benzoquinol methylase
MLRRILDKNLVVVEIGCNEGQLAKRMLSIFDNIQMWNGYDFKEPIKRTAVMNSRYCPIILDDWFHETKLPEFDVFVASHVLEHLSEDQVVKTLNHGKAKYMLLEVPLNEDGKTWETWACTHVLKWGLKHFREWFEFNSYEIFYETTTLGIIGAKNGR